MKMMEGDGPEEVEERVIGIWGSKHQDVEIKDKNISRMRKSRLKRDEENRRLIIQ